MSCVVLEEKGKGQSGKWGQIKTGENSTSARFQDERGTSKTAKGEENMRQGKRDREKTKIERQIKRQIDKQIQRRINRLIESERDGERQRGRGRQINRQT